MIDAVLDHMKESDDDLDAIIINGDFVGHKRVPDPGSESAVVREAWQSNQ